MGACTYWYPRKWNKEAKAAVKNNDINVIVNLSKSEIKSIIKKRLKERWQKQWDKEKKGRWFYRIQRKVGEMRSAGKNRRDEIVISRMRFGHTRLNSTLYKMGKHDTGRCEFCGQEESVEHVILYFQKYETERRILMQNLEKIKMQFKLRDILQNDSRNECYSFIFQYLKITNLWERIYKKKKKKKKKTRGEGSKSFWSTLHTSWWRKYTIFLFVNRQ